MTATFTIEDADTSAGFDTSIATWDWLMTEGWTGEPVTGVEVLAVDRVRVSFLVGTHGEGRRTFLPSERIENATAELLVSSRPPFDR